MASDEIVAQVTRVIQTAVNGTTPVVIDQAEAVARRALAAAEPLILASADRQFLADPDFERRLRDVMRRNPGLLDNYLRQRARIQGAGQITQRR